MIITFEDFTHELTKEEEILVKLMYGFLVLNGERDIWTSGSKLAYTFDVTGPRVRKIIQYIRLMLVDKSRTEKNTPVLIASGEGYKLSRNKVEISEHILSLKQRIAEQKRTLRAIELVYRNQ